MYAYVHIGSVYVRTGSMCVPQYMLYVYVAECSYIHCFVGYVCLHGHAIALLVVYIVGVDVSGGGGGGLHTLM